MKKNSKQHLKAIRRWELRGQSRQSWRNEIRKYSYVCAELRRRKRQGERERDRIRKKAAYAIWGNERKRTIQLRISVELSLICARFVRCLCSKSVSTAGKRCSFHETKDTEKHTHTGKLFSRRLSELQMVFLFSTLWKNRFEPFNKTEISLIKICFFFSS